MSFDCELKPDLVRLVCTYGYNRELKIKKKNKMELENNRNNSYRKANATENP